MDSNVNLGLGILILGAIAVVTAFCGCATCKWKKPWLAVPFVLLAFALGAVMTIVGAVLLAF